MRSNISISTWNINGLSNKVLGDKSKNQDFLNQIKSNDFIFLTETWAKTTISVNGFKAISSILPPKLNQRGRLSGGITLLFNSKFETHVSVIKNSQNFLWCKISKSILKSENDLYLCGTYIPPKSSKYFKSELFDQLEEETIIFSGKGDVILIGDFNARTSKLDDFVSTDGNKHIQNLTQDNSNETKRENFDNIINDHGKNLIEICKNCNMRILNGRTKGDSLGKPTFHSKNGISTIDYVICNISLLEHIKFLVVKPTNYFSDHSQITIWMNAKDNIDKTSEDVSNFSRKLPNQFIWDNISNRTFIESLNLPEIQIKYQNFINKNYPINDEGVNDCLNTFQDLILEAGKKSLKIKNIRKRNKIKNISNKKWFDKDCRLKRHEVRKLANQKHRDPMDIDLRNRYHLELKAYKSILKLKKEEFHEQKLIELESTAGNDPNSFWKVLQTMDDELPINTTPNMISEEQWLFHFQKLHSKHKLNETQNNIIKTLNREEENKNQNQYTNLDHPLSEWDIKIAVKKLKTNKSAYSDRIKNEMIIYSTNILLQGFVKLFNLILEVGNFPRQWCEGLITPIFKSDDRLN
jgi:hypothetical protein